MFVSIDFMTVLLIGAPQCLFLLLSLYLSSKANKRANQMRCIFFFVSSHIIFESFNKMFLSTSITNYYKEPI